MKKLHPRCRKKRPVVFMGLTVSGLPEKTIGQLLGFPAAGSEVTSAAMPRFKRIAPRCTHASPQHASQPSFQMGTLKQKESHKEIANIVL